MTSLTTSTIDLGALPVPGGFFVRRVDAPERTPFPRSTGDGSGYRHSFTYLGGGSTTRADLIDLIDGAREKVFVASYFIGDAQVREALCRAADRLCGGVYVISAMTERDLTRAINEIGDDEDVDVQIERKRFEELTKHGIAVRAYEGCHAKFAVVDDRAALVSSANLTTKGLDTTGENGVLVDVPADADRVARFFAVLWHGSTWEMAMTGEPVVGKNTAGGRPVRLPPPQPGTVGPIWTLHDQHHIKDTIASLISSARSQLLLATFSLDGMVGQENLLFDPVRSAVQRGVSVCLLLRGRNNNSAHSADAQALAKLGVRLYPCSLNHAKGVIADRARGALFSANFDARHGLDRDVELGMRLDGTLALADALRYFEHAIAERDLDYVQDPPAAVLADRLWSRAVSRWPLPVAVDVTTTDADWAELTAVTEGPALFTGGPEDVVLRAGRRAWRLAPPTADDTSGTQPFRLLRLDEREPVRAGARLAEWLTARRASGRQPPAAARRDTDERRGICAATLRRTS
jgi:phosphatidylserine/phosphatidylglycerophosphate/cardiolipin synthase-like enzyme